MLLILGGAWLTFDHAGLLLSRFAEAGPRM
jgi:hypothetical protein